ncbi:homocysteine S-methyltransferase family protein [Primorskyibacter aestuariivivens]|uniref:homocysteine S-methyltransferase family protein n=1 Tax=Primorskyibacter aestuariivivens TaxID=1888912 RepID=UPI0022FFF848|nr:homocysteine S-methyltransferase family protein [Primorskyibacter aestuariivivens]MDA7426976.1 homocysteine S-methyltransferase family protein [Primorskyibacter aestuariivivens]
MTTAPNSPLRDDLFYLTEAGTETEVMYKHGHELPHFAMFTLLENPRAVDDITAMYRRYLDVMAEAGTGAMICGLDYRLSPDWAALLGHDAPALAEIQTRCIDLLKEVSAPYADRLPHIVIGGCVGPRGDAYGSGGTITADEAEAYHMTQLAALKSAGADIACAQTFNNIPEAIGVTRAAERIGLPVAVYFSLDSKSRLNSGPSLREAVETTEAETGGSAAFYGLNCSHPVEFEPAIDDGDWMNRMRSVRPNASKMEKIALCKLGHLEDGDPVELGQQMGALHRRFPQMNVLGGCCGTDERHLREIARNVVG